MTLSAWIEAKNLGKYSEQLSGVAGDLSDLLEMTDEDCDELVLECAMSTAASNTPLRPKQKATIVISTALAIT